MNELTRSPGRPAASSATRPYLRLLSSRLARRDGEYSESPTPVLVAPLDGVPELVGEEFVAGLARDVAAGARVLTYHGRPDGADEVVLTAVLLRATGLAVARGRLRRDRPLPQLRGAFAVHERLLVRDLRLQPGGPPPARRREEPLDPRDMWFWPAAKRLRSDAPDPGPGRTIERGPFRLRCRGDVVCAVDVRPAERHPVEALLRDRPVAQLPALVEALCDDGSVAHAWAHAAAVEGLGGVEPELARDVHRAIGLELERIANHLTGFARLARALGLLAGASAFDRLRATILDLLMRLCGSRRGHGFVRPGAGRAPFGRACLADLGVTLTEFAAAFAAAHADAMTARAVVDRLEGVGVVPRERATELALVGPPARASGGQADLRRDLQGLLHRSRPCSVHVNYDGDCLARVAVRACEIQASVAWILGARELAGRPAAVAPGRLAPRHLAVGAIEGARGPVVHTIETDAAGRIAHYRAQGPSWLNAPGLAEAARGCALADFALCCHSFDLSPGGEP